METTKFEFPVAQMKKPHEFRPEIQRPITVTIEDIKQDMGTFAKQFPTDVIPHIKDNGDIKDSIHNYRRPKPQQQPNKTSLNSKD